MENKITYKTLNESDYDGRRAIIHHLCVYPDFQRRGMKNIDTSEELYCAWV